jgi:hypothetical protein
MMLVVMLPGPLSPTDTVLAANWGGSTKSGFGIAYIDFYEGSQYSKDIDGDDVRYASSGTPLSYAIDSSFDPDKIVIKIGITGDPVEQSNRIKCTLTIKNPLGITVYNAENWNTVNSMTGFIAGNYNLTSGIDWTIPGQYSITAKLYYWM